MESWDSKLVSNNLLVKTFQNTTALFTFLWLKDKYSVIEKFFKIVLKYREPGVCILSHLMS